MHLGPITLLALLAQVSGTLSTTPVRRSYDTHDYYVLEHETNSRASLHEVATALGVQVVEQVGELVNFWLVQLPKPQSVHSSRASEDRVLARYENLKKRAFPANALLSRSEDTLHARRILSAISYLEPQEIRQRIKRAPPPIIEPAKPVDSNYTTHAVALRIGVKDPLFKDQWHLINSEFPQHMMNASPVWDMGYTGKGIISALVDDGVDYKSKDLADNFDAAGSYDYNDHTPLPEPKLFDDHHGTRCAGQIAAVKNEVCGVGIAYNSKIAGIRILSSPISDSDEAAALNYGYQNTSIYSCSWGPPDDGRSMEGPAYIIKKAVLNGIENGRGGKGSIFVFASGNGAPHADQCNFDGYTNSIYSVTVSAIDHKGLHPYYSEACAANMIVAYSSGSGKHIVTTDINGGCSESHGGTSAAAPNAVGVFALALEARPDLTWRDVQHLCYQTAIMINPEDPDWEKIASGKMYSYKYGFGKIDATAYVQAALKWKLVKPQTWVELPAVQINNGTNNLLNEMNGGSPIPKDSGYISSLNITQADLDADNFETLEHITIRVWIAHDKRGDVEVQLLSPNKIISVLAAPRRNDVATSGYPGWKFMTVKHWGENPVGEWKIQVTDQPNNNNGTFFGWSMTLWGSTADPKLARKLDLPKVETLLPSIPHDHVVLGNSTKQHTKPTEHLPGDHGVAEGENSQPAFPGASNSTMPSGGVKNGTLDAVTGPTEPTADEGWFSDLSSLVSNQKWFFGAVALVFVFGAGAAFFFWRRRQAGRRRSAYASLATEDLPMSRVDRENGGGRTKDLYDAFGEVSDDEDADEETSLRPSRQDRQVGGLGFHEGFLDDDPATAKTATTPQYRDEPEGSRHAAGYDSPDARPASDGSWEHASDAR